MCTIDRKLPVFKEDDLLIAVVLLLLCCVGLFLTPDETSEDLASFLFQDAVFFLSVRFSLALELTSTCLMLHTFVVSVSVF